MKAGIDALMISGGSPAAGEKLGPSRLARAGKEGKNGGGYFAEAATKVRLAVGGDGRGKIPIIGVGGWRTATIMETHIGKTCDAFAIARPLINDSGIINKWIRNSDYSTNCVSCNDQPPVVVSLLS